MKRVSAVILSFIFLVFLICPSTRVADAAYSGGYTKVGNVTMPFKEYMPGSFFTKNGSACTCHNDSSIDCVRNGSECNCLRYPIIDGKKVDLLSVQCYGFARYCFYRLFGFLDSDSNDSKFYNAGTLERGEVTADNVKALFEKLKPGAHIRFKLSSSQHSVVLLSKNSDGFTVYHGNASGDGVASAGCVVSTKAYTWKSFADYAYRGIVFANMPVDYPDNVEYLTESPYEGYSVGDYTTTDNLWLREGAGTDYSKVDLIPKGTRVTVDAIDGEWGRTSYEGQDGWICLRYASFIEGNFVTDSLVPKAGSGISVVDGFVYGVPPKTTADALFALFENETLSLSSDQRYIGSGCIISVKVNGENKGQATVIVSGDVNSDGIHSSGDYIVYKAVLNGARTADNIMTKTADMNGDGYISTVDYAILRLSLTD